MSERLAAKDKERLFPGEFYQRFLPVEISGKDLMVVKALADAFARGPRLKDCHLIGAAGQLAVAKALKLSLNGLLYSCGDGGQDYLNTRIDTKTTYCPAGENPVIWVPDDPVRWGTPKIFVGVAVRSVSSVKIQGDILGFLTSTRLKKLIEEKKVLSKTGEFCKVGIESDYLYPLSWLELYLQCCYGEVRRIMGQFLKEEDLEELIQCIPPRSSCDFEESESADLIEFLEF